MKTFKIEYKHGGFREVEAPNFMSLYKFMNYSFTEFWHHVYYDIKSIFVNDVEITDKFKWHNY